MRGPVCYSTFLVFIIVGIAGGLQAEEDRSEEWHQPVMRRAMIWLLYDDWGQEARAYGFERVRETAPRRQKPQVLKDAGVVHLDASGWGDRKSFLYNVQSKQVTPARKGKDDLRRMEMVRFSLKSEKDTFSVKMWWGGQVYFLKIQEINGAFVVSEFTDLWVTLGRRPK